MIKNRVKKMSIASKASLALIVAKFFQNALSMITAPLFTRIMSQSEYGVISTFNSWKSVLYIVATLNLASGVFNNGMLDFKEDRDSFSFSILCLANLFTTITILVILFVKSYTNLLTDIPLVLIYIMILGFYVTPAYNYWMGRQRFEYKYKSITFVMISVSVISTILSIILVLISTNQQKAIAKVLGVEIVNIIVGIIFYIYLLLKSKAKCNVTYWKYALKFNLPLIPHYLSMYVLASSDRIMISNLINTSATAIYNVSYTVASILLIFWNSIDASYAPWIYEKLETKEYSRIGKRGNQILLLFFSLSILSTLFAPEIIAILAPKNYYSGIYVIPAVASGVFFTAVYSLFMRLELYSKKTNIVMIGTVFAAVLNLILNYIFIPKLGFVVAGYTTLVCYILLSIFHYINIWKMGYKGVYDIKAIFALSLGVIVSAMIVSMLYNYTILRYSLIIILVVLLYLKRNKVLNIIKKE